MEKEKPTLTQRADEYIDLQEQIKAVTVDIKDMRDSSTHASDIADLKVQLKALETKRAFELTELDKLCDIRSDCTGQSKLLMEVIAQEMREEVPPLLEDVQIPGITHRGYKFMMRDTLIVKREK